MMRAMATMTGMKKTGQWALGAALLAMAMGIPVLHGVAGESAEIVTAENVGLTFTPEDAGELVDGLLRLRDTAGLRERVAGNGPRAALRYDRRALAADMLAVLERCAAPHWRAADAPDSAAR